MATNRIQNGEVIDFTLSGTVASGDPIVIGNRVGICHVAGVSGETIAVEMEGVYALPKLDAADITAGDLVDWDSSGGEVDDNAMTPAAGDVQDFGIALETKGATTSETIRVLLCHGGTLN